MRVELFRGVPNPVGDGTVFVMRATPVELRLGVEDGCGSHPSASFAVGDTFDAGGFRWIVREILDVGSTPDDAAPGWGSGRAVAFIESIS